MKREDADYVKAQAILANLFPLFREGQLFFMPFPGSYYEQPADLMLVVMMLRGAKIGN